MKMLSVMAMLCAVACMAQSSASVPGGVRVVPLMEPNALAGIGFIDGVETKACFGYNPDVGETLKTFLNVGLGE